MEKPASTIFKVGYKLHFLYKEELSAEKVLTNSTCLTKFRALKTKHNRYSVSFLHVSTLPGWRHQRIMLERNLYCFIYFLAHGISITYVEFDILHATCNIKIGDEGQSFRAKSSLRSHHSESVPRIFRRTIYIQQVTVSPRHSYVF